MPALQKTFQMTVSNVGRIHLRWVLCAFVVLATLVRAQAQAKEQSGNAVVLGSVRDPLRHPLANVTVSLRPASGTKGQVTQTGSDGAYRFTTLAAGVYTISAEINGYVGTTIDPVNLSEKETKQVDFSLTSSTSVGTVKPNSQAPEFYDEPQFTVAGVTQASGSGGHGSDTALRTTEALARATVSLSKDKDKESTGGFNPPTAAANESSLRAALANNPNDPALHHSLGDAEEQMGHPLEAVREYQHAAELDPSEIYLFDWGTELLTHLALEPATEVFAKGAHLFPQSERMLVALAVTWYARGDYNRAAEFLVTASDLAPDSPTPYLFLGKMQRELNFPTTGVTDRLARFAKLRPANALANYYYAVSLWKQAEEAADISPESLAQIESPLLKAVQLDPKFGAAYLELGILYSRHGEFPRAIPVYQKAIAVSAENDEMEEEAHYRLSQAYQRIGDQNSAKQELELRDQFNKKTKAKAANERRSIQEFVVSLQKKDSSPHSQP